VTGGAGFIGNHLCTALVNAKHEVVSVDSAGKCRDPRVVSFTGSVGDFMNDVNLWRVIPNLMNIIERPHPGFDAIIHLADIPRYYTSIERPGDVLSNGYLSTLNLLEYCRRHPFTRFMFISGSDATNDDISLNPHAMSKLHGEQLVTLYRQTFNIMATTVRLFNVFGPGEPNHGQHSALFRRCQDCILTGKDFEVAGDGTQVRDFTHVADTVAGIKASLSELMDGTLRSTCKPVYELGASNAKYSVNDIIAEFAKGTSLKVKKGRRRVTDPQLTMADPQLRPVGWEPVIDPLNYIAGWKELIANGGGTEA
jgi:nucleoside-diphosphate-sugar epimerase